MYIYIHTYIYFEQLHTREYQRRAMHTHPNPTNENLHTPIKIYKLQNTVSDNSIHTAT